MGLGLVMGRTLPPIICTLPEAKRILQPITLGYAWGDGTISDLWSRCAPTPDSIPGTITEKRIISPAHLGEWLEDVLNRQGRPLTDSAQIYMDFMGARKHVR
jgi:hypothetical protein